MKKLVIKVYYVQQKSKNILLILSYSITKSPSAEGIMSALNEVINITSDCKYQRIFHSDRGWAYQRNVYSKALKNNRICQSMSRKRNLLRKYILQF